MYKSLQMGKGKHTQQLKITDWNATPYFSLTLSEGKHGLFWHIVFLCEACRCLHSRLDAASILKTKPKKPGKKVVSRPPDIPLYCDSCSKGARIK